MSVIGVGWFLELVFVFYISFPYYCFLLKNKQRVWLSMGIALFYTFYCSRYFQIEGTNILYSLSLFVLGGILFLYRDKIKHVSKGIVSIFLLISII